MAACLLARYLARFSSDPASNEASKVIRNRGGYWQVKVYAGRDPLTGRERYEYDRARTKREAERVEAALKTKVAEGRHRSTAARTVADLVERWYEWRQGACFTKAQQVVTWRPCWSRPVASSGVAPDGG
jgi:hypothetical protein